MAIWGPQPIWVTVPVLAIGVPPSICDRAVPAASLEP